MDRYKAYIVPGAAAVLLLAYYAWRWSSSPDVESPPPSVAPPSAAAPEARRASTPEDGVKADPPPATVE